MVIVESTLDENVTKALNKASFKKLTILMLVVSLIFILLGIMNIFNDNLVGGLIWIIVGILYMPLVILLTKINQKRINKTLSILSVETKERYEFNNEFILIQQQKGEDYSCETKAKYNYIFQALETNNDFILYISNVQAHVVPKNKIIEGSVEELREILSNNLKEKYKKSK